MIIKKIHFVIDNTNKARSFKKKIFKKYKSFLYFNDFKFLSLIKFSFLFISNLINLVPSAGLEPALPNGQGF